MKTAHPLRLLTTTVILLTAMASLQAATLINYGASWKYFIGTTEASTPVDAWRLNGFSDASWSTGPTPIGFPTAPAAGLEATILTTVPTGTLSVFCRTTFNVPNPLAQTPLSLAVRHDDGFVAWLNGTEIGRFNVPAGAVAFNTAATDHEAVDTPTIIDLASVQEGILVAGPNTLAIQVFNTSGASSDLFLDASLTSAVDDPPALISIDPPPNAIVTSLNVINILFSENMSGVDASDVVINNGNTPVTSILTNNPRDYSFQFSQPATGTVTVAWSASHGITDIDTVPDPFVAGPGWSYTLDPNAIAAPALISEFMADNEQGAEDEDGSRSDWLEIYNPGLIDINLDGWFLTSQSNNLTQWRIPSVNIAPNKYLLVWASEKNRTNPASPLHTNFRISKEGGYLALVNPQLNVVSAFTSYPAQVTDNSYGRDRVDPNLVGYFIAPTPGAQNAMSGSGYAPEPVLSQASGVYTNASVTLSVTIPTGASVVYTLNGTLPTNGSPVYTAPLVLGSNITVKVRALKPGLWPSAVQVRNFVFLDATTRDFNSNLPILILSSEGRTIPQGVLPGQPRTRGTFVVFDTFRGRSSLQRKPDFQGPAEFEVFGQTSAGFPKMPYNVEIQDALGNDKAESILGMPAEADWKLRNPYSDKCLMNDFLAYEMFEQMGNYSVRRKLVEVFVDTGGAKLSYPGDYIGVEVFLEKIERGKDRVDIAELQPGDTNEPAITGGYMFKRDKPSPSADLDFSTTAGTSLKIHEPKPRDVNNNINHPHVLWLRRYLSAYETAVNAANWTTATGTNHYSHYIDVDSFVDQHWIVEFPNQIDGYRISNFFSKDRNAKVKNVPIWDWNLAFGNANYLEGGKTNTWYYPQLGANDHLWLRRLVGAANLPNSGGDPDFIQKIIDRWGTLRTNVMNGDRVVKRIDEIATLLNEAAGRNFSKFNYLNAYQWPNPEGLPFHVDYTQPTYALIISEMKKWTMGRYLWVDGQFPKQPTLSLAAGNVTPGSTVFMTAPAGTIYYTTDGSDPRAQKSNGALAPGASTYAGPITINGNARVFARARNGNVWSPPTIATYVVQTPSLVISELMYHPPIPGVGTNSAEDFEYIELKNIGTSALDLGGYSLSGGVQFTFPSSMLAVGQRILVVANQTAFTARYGAGLNIAGQYTNQLDNAGERIVLKGRYQEPILDFSYENNWYRITDGLGFSLVIADENAAASAWSLKTQWRPSGSLNGTPGAAETTPSFPRIVVNEILTHTVPPAFDIIELRNLESTNVNLGGWFLSDDRNNPKKYRIPNNTVITGNGYLQFNETAFNDTNSANFPFALSSLGDDVFVFSADLADNLTGYIHGYDYGAQRTGVTFGRHILSTGEEHLVAQASASLGSANSGPLVGPVVISEVMYRPPSVYANGAYWNNSEDEFIELRNSSGATLNLFDSSYPSNTWKLDGAVEFSFPMGVSLPSGGTLLVVNFNPALEAAQLAAFRSRYGISPAIPLFGPYQGDLANSDESVSVYMPDTPVAIGPDAGLVGYVLVDRVHYFDSLPWPTSPDGLGHSLQRLNLSAYGNDAANWTAGAPTAGADYVSGAGPTISMNPVNQTVLGSTTASLTGLATGPGPITYGWFFNGNLIDGASNNVLTIPNVQLANAGSYQMVALNPFGSADSTLATLTVLVPPTIIQQPIDVLVRVKPDPAAADKTNAVFSVAATTINPPLLYQWRFNGTNMVSAPNISGITSPNLVISNVTIADGGQYSAAITDASGTIYTTNASLYPLVTPIIVPGLISHVAVTGAPVTLSIAMPVGNPLPFTVEWRRGSTGVATNVVNAREDFVTVPAPLPAAANVLYRVLVRNLATTGQGIVATNLITSYIDSDGDRVPDPFDSNPGANDATLDSDEDGVNNYAEYVAGTDPNSNQSYLRVSGITATGGAQLEFIAVSNRTYSVEYKNSVTNPVWSNLSNIAALPTNRVHQVVDPSPSTNRFYRLVTPKR